VTGSNGKTTTCRLLETTLSLEMPGIASVKSFNNHIGLPLTLLRATPEHRFVICETGTSGPGEIAALTSIARPDIALITSVGRAHLEKLIDLAGVAREKASIARGLGPGGLLLASFDSAELRAELAAGSHAGRTATYGRTAGANHLVEAVKPTVVDERDGVAFRLDGAPFEVTLTGEHNALNAAATALVARSLGLDDDAIARGLRQAAPPPMRMQRSVVRGVTLWNDAYNANPESMAAAASDFLARAPDDARRVLVLGDMLELGAGAEAAHEEVGRRIGAAGRVDLLCCVGGLARSIGVGLAARRPGIRIEAFDLEDEAPARVASLLAPGDWALLKGSRGVRLERVEEALRGAVEHSDAPVGAGDA
jgi:UDP-N-acetylmuramoyl-tripeptide--D-alanyl-D-alanine ligase